eukprot:TRINITY_DN9232_c0_g1_i1.p1 TRINITY_DN9232_c0_g1~~TRINITY_DN9232_c0_g1_i1.p1  ORF type:complete len:316 (+),score=110.96 TRINITY_DN9232_c0_g1_i1:124-948(+)
MADRAFNVEALRPAAAAPFDALYAALVKDLADLFEHPEWHVAVESIEAPLSVCFALRTRASEGAALAGRARHALKKAILHCAPVALPRAADVFARVTGRRVRPDVDAGASSIGDPVPVDAAAPSPGAPVGAGVLPSPPPLAPASPPPATPATAAGASAARPGGAAAFKSPPMRPPAASLKTSAKLPSPPQAFPSHKRPAGDAGARNASSLSARPKSVVVKSPPPSAALKSRSPPPPALYSKLPSAGGSASAGSGAPRPPIAGSLKGLPSSTRRD